MKTLYKMIIVLVIFLLLISLIYFFSSGNNNPSEDTEPPAIDFITGNTTGTPGKITTIIVNFSDNFNVTTATVYYRPESGTNWLNMSIINRSADISIPLEPVQDWYYYVVIDDAAGNGPVGDPSVDGSKYYIITVTEEKQDLIHYVFVEKGTATNCKFCPEVANILHELYTSGKYNFYYVSLVEDQTEFNSKAADRLNNHYNMFGKPTVFVDGGYKVITGAKDKSEYINAITKAESRNVPQIQVSVDVKYENETEKLVTNILVENYEPERYEGQLKVYLTEIISRWHDNDDNPYHFSFIDYIITESIIINGEDDKIVDGEYDVPSFDPDNLMVIAVVFNSESITRYANPPDQNPFDAYYADATAAAKVVEAGNLPPEVRITIPERGKLHIFGKPLINTLLGKTILIGRLTITVEASDDDGIEKVEFYLDGELVQTVEEKPYQWVWKTPSWFTLRHTIKAVAYDNQGKSSSTTREVVAFILL
jgi:hypothetical protein